jgi:hypothetical protein
MKTTLLHYSLEMRIKVCELPVEIKHITEAYYPKEDLAKIENVVRQKVFSFQPEENSARIYQDQMLVITTVKHLVP